MFDAIQTFCLGLAAVIDTALLITLLERRNRRRVLPAVAVLASSVWVVHTGTLFGLLVREPGAAGGSGSLEGLAVSAVVVGLLLLPCALVHLLLRLRLSGFDRRPPVDWRHALLYAPAVLAVAWLAERFAAGARVDVAALVAPYARPYGAALTLILGLAGAGALRARSKTTTASARSFFLWMATILGTTATILLATIFYGLHAWPASRHALVLVNILLPIVPLVLFAYFVARFNFMGLVLERTVVYGVIVVAVLLFHHLAVADLASRLEERYRVDFVVLEGIAVVLLIMLYGPLRQRAAEALRYLMGIRVGQVRERCRDVAYRLSSLGGKPPPELLSWFVDAVRDAMRLDYVAGWQLGASGAVSARAGESHRLDAVEVVALYRSLTEAGEHYYSRDNAPDENVLRVLESNAASLVLAFGRGSSRGLFLFGRRTRARDLGEEDISTIMILVEQLRGTMTTSRLQAERLAAERQALQNEKLSAMGLLCSSLAHEVKNPLSSVKTIATVMAEESGPDHPHAADLRLLLGEVERLERTSREWLEFVRPAAAGEQAISPGEVVARTVRVLKHLAGKKGVVIECRADEDLPAVELDENALREIIFNLIANALEAIPSGGKVLVSCARENGLVSVSVRDDGPGIFPEVRERLFDPFVTTKKDGTGLGLYVASHRVAQLGGEIRCDSEPVGGTRFTVTLPISEPRS